MAFLDLEQLTSPLSDDQPSGESMEYDAMYIALEAASRGKAEQQYGDNIIPAEPPDWAEVRRLSLQLSEQTKDLRVACFLARALLALEGLGAFVEGLELVLAYLDQYWDSVHPQLDPDDDMDPTFRVNTLSSLNDAPTTVTDLRHSALVSAGPIGSYSLLDMEIAKGEKPPLPDEEAPTEANIEAAFEAAGSESLRDSRNHANRLVEIIEEIESKLTAAVGAAASLSFDNLRDTTKAVVAILNEQCQRMGVYDEPETEVAEEEASAEDGAPAASAAAGAAPVAPVAPVSLEITSREDVVKTLDRLCKYYEKYEPSSPLPLLLKRAKRLASMSFLDIIKDLSPEALGQARAVGGFFDEMPAAEEPDE